MEIGFLRPVNHGGHIRAREERVRRRIRTDEEGEVKEGGGEVSICFFEAQSSW